MALNSKYLSFKCVGRARVSMVLCCFSSVPIGEVERSARRECPGGSMGSLCWLYFSGSWACAFWLVPCIAFAPCWPTELLPRICFPKLLEFEHVGLLLPLLSLGLARLLMHPRQSHFAGSGVVERSGNLVRSERSVDCISEDMTPYPLACTDSSLAGFMNATGGKMGSHASRDAINSKSTGISLCRYSPRFFIRDVVLPFCRIAYSPARPAASLP